MPEYDDLPYWLREKIREMEKTWVPGPFEGTGFPVPEDPDAEPAGGWDSTAGKRLSVHQRAILIHLWEETQRCEGHSDRARRIARQGWGVRWKPSQVWTKTELTPSHRAAMSRSLRRMEERGLLHRLNDWTGRRRTTCVRLTPEGRRVARQLSNG